MTYERKVFKDYAPSDVRDAYQHAHPSSWSDLVDYLQAKGLQTWHLTPGEDAHMVADLKAVIQDHVPFCDNWEKAYEILKSHRKPELVKAEEQHWIQKSERYEKEREERYQQQQRQA